MGFKIDESLFITPTIFALILKNPQSINDWYHQDTTRIYILSVFTGCRGCEWCRVGGRERRSSATRRWNQSINHQSINQSIINQSINQSSIKTNALTPGVCARLNQNRVFITKSNTMTRMSHQLKVPSFQIKIQMGRIHSKFHFESVVCKVPSTPL